VIRELPEHSREIEQFCERVGLEWLGAGR